jgi:2-polyprenyl-3-methyl-5-hydroxy-6-metoxy-1,4-benzoquinol methylase
MTAISFSKKGLALVELYKQMATEGYQRSDGSKVEDAFADFELRTYRPDIKKFFETHKVKTVLDYGCGGSDWGAPDFNENGQSAKEYFNLEQVFRYEPARNIDERGTADGVVCFDVLEHIFIQDLPSVIRDLFSCANNCSTGWRQTSAFKIWKARDWADSPNFVTQD